MYIIVVMVGEEERITDNNDDKSQSHRILPVSKEITEGRLSHFRGRLCPSLVLCDLKQEFVRF